MTNPALTRLGLVLANATELIDTPLPGVYPDISHTLYHKWPAASNSRLSKIRQSPAHLKAYIEEPFDTAALAFGRALHVALLEPDDFTRRYVVAERCTAIQKNKERCANPGTSYIGGEWFCGVHGKGIGPNTAYATVLPHADWMMILRMRDSVYAHPKAKRLLTGKGMNELSALWNDEKNGLLCKARFDRCSPEFGALVDIKTTVNASRDAFERAIYNYGYHRQGAHYLTGAKATGLQAGHFVNIAVEKERPYAVAVYRLDEAALEAGLVTLRPLLDRYKQCIDTDTWPGYSDQIEDIAIPAYGFQQADTEMREAQRA